MKAEELLKKIKESNKTPSYQNANTPNNHVGSKGMKKISDPKKGLGQDPTMRAKVDVGKPKKEKRSIDPVPVKPKKLKGARYGVSEEVKAKPEKRMNPSKSVSVRSKQDDSPKNKGDSGKPGKPENKSKMVPNPVTAKKMAVRGQISELEQLLGSKLDVSTLFEDDFEDDSDGVIDDKYEIERIGVDTDKDGIDSEFDPDDITDEEIEGQFKIIGTRNGKKTTLDVAPTEDKARELVGEFQLAFGDPWQISYEPV